MLNQYSRSESCLGIKINHGRYHQLQLQAVSGQLYFSLNILTLIPVKKMLIYSATGHIVLDEDLERTVLVVNLGIIPPMETVHILVSTSSELSTLPSGGIRVSSPPVCTPRVQRTINEEQGLSPNFSRT